MITSKYPIETFRDVLDPVDRAITIDDLSEYNCVGVRLYGRGAFARETRLGAVIKRKRQSVVRTGDVIFNKLFAWRGTFAIVHSALDHSIASDKYPLYAPRTDVVRPRFLAWWFQTEELANEARLLSRGAAALSKLTLNPPDFWKLPIPLPTPQIQDRLVDLLDNTIGAIDRLIELRAPIDAVLQGRRAGVGSELRLTMSAALSAFGNAYGDRLGILDAVLAMRPRSGPSFPCAEDGAGIPVVMPSALGGYRLDESKCLFGSGVEILDAKDLLRPGDLLIARGNKRDQVGLCVVYDSSCRRTYANLLMRFQVAPERALPTFVKYWMMTPIAVAHIRRNTKGTSPSVQKINQKALIATPFPRDVPPSEQAEWVSYLDNIFNGADALERLARDQNALAIRLRKATLSSIFAGTSGTHLANDPPMPGDASS